MTTTLSNKPYLIRALHQWCMDAGLTPYLAVFVTEQVQVPMEYVNNQEIILNISVDACQQLDLGNEWISFKARFGGVPREIIVPVTHVMAVYAKENSQGMSFPVERSAVASDATSAKSEATAPQVKGKPSLKIVK